MKDLEAAVAQIQEGAKAALGCLAALNAKETELGERVSAVEGKLVDATAQLAAIHQKTAHAEAGLVAANAALDVASRGAKEKADFIIEAGKTEAKRLIEEANASCETIIGHRNTAHKELAAVQEDLAKAKAERDELRAHTAAAKENFLKAVSH